MSKKALIFGVTGQDGHYLSQILKKENIQVVGVSRQENTHIKGDVSHFDFVKTIMSKETPDFIFHFAATSSTSHNYLFENHQSISTGTLNILENARLHCPKAKVFLSGSAMQFKNDGNPINEKTPFEASSPYAVARIQSAYAARYYRNKFKMNIYVGYFFNHDSPLRTENHINKKITNAIKRIADGHQEKIEIGDLEVKKEFNFAGDMMEAVWLLINQNKIHEVVIGSGEAYKIKDFIDYCFFKINKDANDYIVPNNNFIPEYKTLISDPTLIKSMGWKPKMNFKQLSDLMME